jgi:uncharacterized protein (DUF362 family)/NAD-dependent dihydropyrimidine dehydrogenase PreA subunit
MFPGRGDVENSYYPCFNLYVTQTVPLTRVTTAMSKVLIHPATYQNLNLVLDRIFELFPLDVQGKNVLIKPNVLRASKAEEGIVTHPAVVRAIVEKVERMRPASIVVGDNPGVFCYGANEETFKKTGLMEAAKGYYRNIGNDSERVNFNPDFAATVSISRAVLDADIIISAPKFKTHGLTVITGAIKNSYGILPGAQKAKLHKAAGGIDRFHEMVVDVYRLRVPDLFVMDAVVGMEGNGPACSDLREMGLVLASNNGVALDAIMAKLVGCEPGRLRFLQRAKQVGLGDYDLSTIEIIGELKKISNFKLPPLSGEAILGNEAAQARLHGRTILRPQVDPKLCTACGTCVDQCPVSALSLNGQIPYVNSGACIVCFCCQEICPEKAITLK